MTELTRRLCRSSLAVVASQNSLAAFTGRHIDLEASDIVKVDSLGTECAHADRAGIVLRMVRAIALGWIGYIVLKKS